MVKGVDYWEEGEWQKQTRVKERKGYRQLVKGSAWICWKGRELYCCVESEGRGLCCLSCVNV